jgi:hypothetical protein
MITTRLRHWPRRLRWVLGLAVLSMLGSPAAFQASSQDPKPASVTAPPGFVPPPPGAFVTQALVPWVNRKTGERFTAPTGGWRPPSDDWVIDVQGGAGLPASPR